MRFRFYSFLLGTFSFFYCVSLGAQPFADNSFGSSGVVVTTSGLGSDFAKQMVVQPDGKIIQVGDMGMGWAGTNVGCIRLNSNGTLDNSFGVAGKFIYNLGFTSSVPNSVALQLDGKILITGWADDNFFLLRLTSTGNLDPSFANNGVLLSNFPGASYVMKRVVCRSDGKIFLAGERMVSAENDLFLASITPTGNYDAGFGSGGVLQLSMPDYQFLIDMELTSGGKPVIFFSSDSSGSSVRRYYVQRLNENGTSDAIYKDLVIHAAVAYAGDLKMLSGDKMLVVGTHLNLPTNEEPVVIRLNANLTPDNSFGTGGRVFLDMSTDDETGIALALQPDGRIIVGGTNYGSGVSPVILFRLSADGVLDTDFGNSGVYEGDFTPSDDFLESLHMQADGKLLINGITFNGMALEPSFLAVRMILDIDFSVDESSPGNSDFSFFPNPADDLIHLISEKDFTLGVWSVSGKLVREQRVSGNTTLDISSLSGGVYFLRNTSAEGQTQMLIKR